MYSCRVQHEIDVHFVKGKDNLAIVGFRQNAARQQMNKDIGVLVPFHAFYPAIESFLDTNVKRIFEQAAEKASLDPYDINILKSLFLIRYVDLVTRRSTFSKGELVAFDVDAGSNLDASSDGTVMVNLVVRDADGKIVDSSSSVLVWKDMWEKNMFVGYFPRTPQTDGDYTLSIYIGNQLLDSAKFTVKS